MNNTSGFIDLLTTASPVGLFAIFIVALLKRWLILPREIDEKDKRIAQLEAERDEYKGMVFQALNIGERLTSASEQQQYQPPPQRHGR